MQRGIKPDRNELRGLSDHAGNESDAIKRTTRWRLP